MIKRLRAGVDSVNGSVAVIGLVAFPVSIAALAVLRLTEWPGQLMWLLAGAALPARFRVFSVVAAASAAALEFLAAWCALAFEDKSFRTDGGRGLLRLWLTMAGAFLAAAFGAWLRAAVESRLRA